jgi:hypothetical protein
MKTHFKVALLWGICVPTICADQLAFHRTEAGVFADGFIMASSFLVGIVSLYLWKKEIRKGTRWVFANFSMLFLINAMVSPVFDLCKYSLRLTDDWVSLWYYQYQLLAYFLFLTISVLFLIVDSFLNYRGVIEKYVWVFAVVSIAWGTMAYPFFTDPKVLLKEPSYRDYLLIRKSVANLQSMGSKNPTPAHIASNLESWTDKGAAPLAQLPTIERERRIAEILPYVPGYNGLELFFAPLWSRCALLGLVNVILLLIFAVRQYLVNSYSGAYIEKIVWCLLVYCVFEALHFYVFANVSDDAVQQNMAICGEYLSMVVMLALCGLFALRLRFIESIEGGYYERRLFQSAEGVTRWRDSFDDWVVRQFINSEQLDRRFAVRRRSA